MKDVRNTILEAATKQLAGEWPFFWLIAVRIPSEPPTWFRATNFRVAVERGTDNAGHPIIFYPFPVAFGELLEDVQANLSDVTINVANCTREIGNLIDTYDGLADQPVILTLVHSQGISDPNAGREFRGEVLRCHVTDEVATFSVSATILARENFPKNRLNAKTCGRIFGDEGCGYVIPASPGETVGTGFSTCNRELENCEERGADEAARSLTVLHPLRFDACPGLQSGSR